MLGGRFLHTHRKTIKTRLIPITGWAFFITLKEANTMTSEMLLTNDQPLRFKIIRPVYEVLTVNDKAAEYFEPLEAISSSAHVVRLFDFLGRKTREHFWAVHLDSKNKLLCLDPISTGSLNASIVHPREVFKSCLLSSAAALLLVTQLMLSST